MIPNATYVGTGPIPGADHDAPVRHYKLTPGSVYILTKEGIWSVGHIEPHVAESAKPIYEIAFMAARPIVCFDIGGRTVAQPIPPFMAEDPPKRARAPARPAKSGPREAPRKKIRYGLL